MNTNILNSTALSDRSSPCLHTLFELQVVRAPNAIAIVSGEDKVTYRELNNRANALAQHLLSINVQPEELVGLKAERGIGLLVGMLGILKAGAAYLPLDPIYPNDRLQFMAEDASLRFVVTSESNWEAGGQSVLQVIEVEVASQLQGSCDNPDIEVAQEALAYAIYTSGSTGKPKGALITHLNVVRLFTSTEHWFNFTESDVWTLFHSYAFDFSVWEIWGALLFGGRLVIVPQQISRSPEDFRELLIHEKVTVLNQTPSAFFQLLRAEQAKSKAVYSLRYIVFGGEALEFQGLRPWFDRYGDSAPALVNMYGITETTVHVTYKRVRIDDLEKKQGSVIGEPISDLKLYVLREDGTQAATDEEGEMFVGGAGVARGYLNRPQLTSERFIHDPFSKEQSSTKLYRTGDLARVLSSGEIEYLGRIDHQVKIRGFRIETGEIEACIAAEPWVNSVSVIACDIASDKRLVAYIASSRRHHEALPELKRMLNAVLPDYMVPAHFVFMDELPLTINGKVDRKQLPPPHIDIVSENYIAPRDAMETTIADVFTKTLGISQVGIHDNFFELGGHSLLVMEVVHELARLQLTVEVSKLFLMPTVAELAKVVVEGAARQVPANLIPLGCRQLKPEMLTLVELTEKEIHSIEQVAQGGASNIQDVYPLTHLQQGMLYHYQLSSEYDPYIVFTLLGAANRRVLDNYARALQQVIERHDILRTGFVWQGLKAPLQIVCRSAMVPVIEVPEPQEGGDIATYLMTLSQTAEHRIDPRCAPLIKLFITYDSDCEQWVMLRVHHHLLEDHTADELMSEEIYQILQGNADALPPALPFRDLVAFQQLDEQHDEHQAFFTEQLASLESASIPFGLAATSGNSNISEFRLQIEDGLANRVYQMAANNQVSAASVFHLAWALVVARCSGQQDVVFGTVLFGRMSACENADAVVGPFINTLPLRVKLNSRNVADALKEVYRSLAATTDHEQAPLTLAQSSSGIEGGMPLFNALINYRHLKIKGRNQIDIHPMEAAIERMGLKLLMFKERTNYPLQLSVDDLGSGFVIEAQSQSPIEPEKICNYVNAALENIISALESAPSKTVSRLGILPPLEQARLLKTWNSTDREYLQPALLHRLFERQVIKTPKRTALEFNDQFVSYAELDAKANQLARYLCERGVKKDVLVGVFSERSFEMVVALFAILKAGGAYVPLDPTYPSERLGHMLEDAQVDLVLTQSHLKDQLPSTVVEPHIIDVTWGLYSRLSDEPLDTEPSSSDLAYVIFTSGSTGRPKGAMNEHRGICNRLLWMQETFELGEEDCVVQKTPFSFDVSVWEFFWPLMAGARLVIARPEGHRDAQYLAQLMLSKHVTTMHFVPSMLRVFLEQKSIEHFPSVKRVMCSGEALPHELQVRFFERFPNAELHNLYGPTEAAVDVTHWQCVRDDKRLTVPIGRPIANTHMYILDQSLMPVPIGVAGDLYIGGVQVGRGYIGRDDLTQERFIPNPFSNSEGARLYKTGDLAKFLPDGNIEYLGRSDFQVKIRGQRIELGEIEAVLEQQVGVSQSVVLLNKGAIGEERLVAYLVTDQNLEIKDLKSSLANQLPQHMVPAFYILLDELPLTPSGKVDRKVLPDPDGVNVLLPNQQSYSAPRNALEVNLVNIWQEILGVERVGIHDNFFELGGHSLLAVALVERMGSVGISNDVSTLFQHPTIASFVSVAKGKGGGVDIPPNLIPKNTHVITPEMLSMVHLSAAQVDAVVASVPGGAANIQDIYPLAPLQEGFLFHHMLSTVGDLYIMETQFAFDSRKRVDDYIEALQWVVNRHDIQRTLFLWEGLPEPVQVVCRKAQIPVEYISLDDKDGDVAEQLASRINLRNYRIDLAQPPMIRVFVAEDKVNDRWVFHQLTHHLMDDQTTVNLQEEELKLYLDGQAEQLLEPTPYRNYVAQARGGISKSEYESFFKKMLDGLSQPTSPYKLMDVLGDGAAIDEARALVTQEISRRIYTVCQLQGVSTASMFHLAWALMLSKISNSEDVVFGTVLLGRMQGGEANGRILGPCINTLPFRVQLDESSVGQSLRKTQELLASILPYEFAPLGMVQRCSNLDKNTPLFNSILNYRRPSQGTGVVGDKTGIGNMGVQPAELINSEWFSEEIEGRKFIRFLERTNYPITMSVDDFGEGFRLVSQVQSPIDPKRICDYMLTALEQILTALESSNEKSLKSLSILPVEEQQLLLTRWNDTVSSYDLNEPLHRLIEKQVAKKTDAVALEFEGKELTYSGLDEKANQLARYLRKRGITRESLVGVYAERSLDLVISLLAILKSGGAYVPLDPSYPAERLAHMLDDANVSLILTQEHLAGHLPTTDTPYYCVDNNEAHQHESVEVLKSVSASTNLAYVIFTSGSTGRPKGAMNEHRGICNRLLWMQEAFRLGSGDTVLQKTPFSFDVSVWEFFWPLMTGARLTIARPEGHKDPVYLIEKIQQENVTTLHFVPSMLRVFLECNGVERCASIRRVICSGEALSHELQERFYECFPNAELHNLYGPTEAAVDVSHWACQKHDMRLTVPIGRPIANTQLYILNEDRNLAPAGVEGELYIGGVQVGRGYIGRQDLTTERFVKDPFSKDEGARLYRTGDLARYLPDGNIEYLGRQDFQVKIRGQRIELGEIEAVLDKQDGIAQSVVVLKESVSSDQVLVAYVVAEDFSENQVKKSLLQHLPKHMVPMVYVVLRDLPLTSSGKVDRKALPEPNFSRSSSSDEASDVPRNDLEICLASIWRKVLGVDRIGINDNFFDLGGHSLNLIKLVVEMRQAAGIEVDIGSIYRYPTIAALVASIEKGGVPQSSVIVPLQADGSGIPVFCISGVNIYKEFAQSLGTEQAVYGVYVSEEKEVIDDVLQGRTPKVQTEQLIDAYCAAIMRYNSNAPCRLAGISFGGILAVKLAYKLSKLGVKVDLVILFDSLLPSATSFNLGRWVVFAGKSLFSRKALEKLDKTIGRLKSVLVSKARGSKGDSSGLVSLKGEAALFARTKVSFSSLENDDADFKVVLFRASQTQCDLPYHDIEQSYGWSEFLGDRLSVEDVVGSHLSLIQSPNVNDLANRAQRYLK